MPSIILCTWWARLENMVSFHWFVFIISCHVDVCLSGKSCRCRFPNWMDTMLSSWMHACLMEAARRALTTRESAPAICRTAVWLMRRAGACPGYFLMSSVSYTSSDTGHLQALSPVGMRTVSFASSTKHAQQIFLRLISDEYTNQLFKYPLGWNGYLRIMQICLQLLQ